MSRNERKSSAIGYLVGPHGPLLSRFLSQEKSDAEGIVSDMSGKLEKLASGYIRETTKGETSEKSIDERLSEEVERKIGNVRMDQRGKFTRLCAATVVECIYLKAVGTRNDEIRANLSLRAQKVLYYGNEMTINYEGQRINPEVISAVFVGIRDAIDVDDFIFEVDLRKYVEDPFTPPENIQPE